MMREYEYSFHTAFDPPPLPARKARTLREFRARAAHILQPTGTPPDDSRGENLREEVRCYVREWKRLRRKRAR